MTRQPPSPPAGLAWYWLAAMVALLACRRDGATARPPQGASPTATSQAAKLTPVDDDQETWQRPKFLWTMPNTMLRGISDDGRHVLVEHLGQLEVVDARTGQGDAPTSTEPQFFHPPPASYGTTELFDPKPPRIHRVPPNCHLLAVEQPFAVVWCRRKDQLRYERDPFAAVLAGVDLTNGKTRWQRQVTELHGLSAAINDTSVFWVEVGPRLEPPGQLHSRGEISTRQVLLHASSRLTGKDRWVVPAAEVPLNGNSLMNTLPQQVVLSDSGVIVTDGGARAYRVTDGALLWSYEKPSKPRNWAALTDWGQDVSFTGRLKTRRLWFAAYGHDLEALDPANGAVVRTLQVRQGVPGMPHPRPMPDWLVDRGDDRIILYVRNESASMLPPAAVIIWHGETIEPWLAPPSRGTAVVGDVLLSTGSSLAAHSLTTTDPPEETLPARERLALLLTRFPTPTPLTLQQLRGLPGGHELLRALARDRTSGDREAALWYLEALQDETDIPLFLSLLDEPLKPAAPTASLELLRIHALAARTLAHFSGSAITQRLIRLLDEEPQLHEESRTALAIAEHLARAGTREAMGALDRLDSRLEQPGGWLHLCDAADAEVSTDGLRNRLLPCHAKTPSSEVTVGNYLLLLSSEGVWVRERRGDGWGPPALAPHAAWLRISQPSLTAGVVHFRDIMADGQSLVLADILRDQDGDGIPDQTEAWLQTDPQRADTDGDGVPDGEDRAPLDAPATTPESAILAGFLNDYAHFRSLQQPAILTSKTSRVGNVTKAVPLFLSSPVADRTSSPALETLEISLGERQGDTWPVLLGSGPGADHWTLRLVGGQWRVISSRAVP